MTLTKLTFLGTLAVALLVPTGVSAAPEAKPVKSPVIKIKHSQFGNVLARRDGQALYYWAVEKRDGNRIHCTGGCAVAWPPLIVRSRAAVVKKVPGLKGSFGTVRRPDGRLQVTWNRQPLYTYVNEGPREVRCDNVDDWFVARF